MYHIGCSVLSIFQAQTPQRKLAARKDWGAVGTKGIIKSQFSFFIWLFSLGCFSVGLIICFLCSAVPGGLVHKKYGFFLCSWTLHIFEHSQNSCQIWSLLGLSGEKKKKNFYTTSCGLLNSPLQKKCYHLTSEYWGKEPTVMCRNYSFRDFYQRTHKIILKAFCHSSYLWEPERTLNLTACLEKIQAHLFTFTFQARSPRQKTFPRFSPLKISLAQYHISFLKSVNIYTNLTSFK